MVLDACPGASKFKRPEPEDIKCSYCGAEVEIWTDEVTTKCSKCKKEVSRPQGQSCLEWCKSARECVGDKIYNKFLENKKKGEEKK